MRYQTNSMSKKTKPVRAAAPSTSDAGTEALDLSSAVSGVAISVRVISGRRSQPGQACNGHIQCAG
jgi:hypothetical protein